MLISIVVINKNRYHCSGAVFLPVMTIMLVKFSATVSILFLLLCSSNALLGQGCSTLGQTPATAFPLCTKDTFIQSTVPICTNKRVVVPGCNASTGDYADKNPFWYRFTCFQTGTLGFLITPKDLTDDYDWELYDVTGVIDLNAVYSNAALFVVGNWSGSSGLTGASPKGTSRVECASAPADNINTFSIMPTLQKDHNYLLLVSHFSDSQSGYSIFFTGGNAVINDPRLPDLHAVKPSCDPTVITLKLNMKLKCNSLSADGSDFSITPAQATVIAATAGNCSSSFDMDSVTLVLSNALPSGNYSLQIKKGKDANTLLDDCDRDIPEGHSLPFSIAPPQPTLLDSIAPLTCSPVALQLVFSKNIRCSSIAADGSDFVLSGPAPVTVKSATAVCSNGSTGVITLGLASPVVKGGVYQVTLKTGTDNNTIINECGLETPAGSAASFTVKDTVSADFSYQLKLGCRTDTIVFDQGGANAVDKWLWIFDNAGIGSHQTESVIFKTFGDKQILLQVSNGFCSDTLSKTIRLDNTLKASFKTEAFLCPEDAASFTNNSIGKITGYNWSFGDGTASILQTPPPKTYTKTGIETAYPVQLIVKNDLNCYDTVTSPIKVLRTCYIAVPNAFTPNGDGKDDYLYPLNAFKADNLNFNIFNRLGQKVFHGSDWTQKWDGSIGGHPQGTGVYVWTLQYTEHDSGKKVSLRGSSVLIR